MTNSWSIWCETLSTQVRADAYEESRLRVPSRDDMEPAPCASDNSLRFAGPPPLWLVRGESFDEAPLLDCELGVHPFQSVAFIVSRIGDEADEPVAAWR